MNFLQSRLWVQDSFGSFSFPDEEGSGPNGKEYEVREQCGVQQIREFRICEQYLIVFSGKNGKVGTGIVCRRKVQSVCFVLTLWDRATFLSARKRVFYR